ncbi:hypothetical protein CR513_15918, partial [Mucuna pruriens]
MTLTDGEEPKCYQESMESEERQKAWQSKLQMLLCPLPRQSLCNSSFHSSSKHIDVSDVLDAKLLELVKVHTDDNGVDMMTKRVPRGKFEACCEIFGLKITST